MGRLSSVPVAFAERPEQRAVDDLGGVEPVIGVHVRRNDAPMAGPDPDVSGSADTSRLTQATGFDPSSSQKGSSLMAVGGRGPGQDGRRPAEISAMERVAIRYWTAAASPMIATRPQWVRISRK